MVVSVGWFQLKFHKFSDIFQKRVFLGCRFFSNKIYMLFSLWPTYWKGMSQQCRGAACSAGIWVGQMLSFREFSRSRLRPSDVPRDEFPRKIASKVREFPCFSPKKNGPTTQHWSLEIHFANGEVKGICSKVVDIFLGKWECSNLLVSLSSFVKY